MPEALHVDIVVGDATRPRLAVRLQASHGILAVTGPSGAGKSTLLHAIAGLVTPTSGQITLGPRALFSAQQRNDIAPQHRHCGLVFQDLALFPHCSALENVAFGVRLPRALRSAHALQWLDRVQLGHLAQRRPAQLSGGEMQRVALARALASAPKLLLLDEPFSALDDALRSQLRQAMVRWVAELDVIALWVTHDAEDTKLAAAQLTLDRGQLRARVGPSETV